MLEVRELKRGGWVVDLGNKWFVVNRSDQVTVKETGYKPGADFGCVISRKPTRAEIKFARNEVFKFCGRNF